MDFYGLCLPSSKCKCLAGVVTSLSGQPTQFKRIILKILNCHESAASALVSMCGGTQARNSHPTGVTSCVGKLVMSQTYECGSTGSMFGSASSRKCRHCCGRHIASSNRRLSSSLSSLTYLLDYITLYFLLSFSFSSQLNVSNYPSLLASSSFLPPCFSHNATVLCPELLLSKDDQPVAWQLLSQIFLITQNGYVR